MKKFLMCLMLVLSVVAFQPNNGILAQEEALVDDSFLELEEADTFAGKCTVPEEVAESIIPTMKLFDDTGIWVPSGPRAACETQTITIGDIRIASCNVGATVAGTGENSYGYHFQRGRNVGFPHEDDGIDAISTAAVEGPQSLVAAGEHTNFIKSGTSPYDWLTPQNNNLR